MFTRSTRLNPDEARSIMVECQIRNRGIRDSRILAAFSKVLRHRFVSAEFSDRAYEDYPLPIGAGQTISQPYMAALMTEALDPQPNQKILEIGTGSGYQTAILAELALQVWTIERIPSLAETARGLLQEMGYRNVTSVTGDGTMGLPEVAPFDGIIVTAGAPIVPQPLYEQLALGSRLVIPVGGAFNQELMIVTRTETGMNRKNRGGCIFVKLIGKHGWNDELQH